VIDLPSQGSRQIRCQNEISKDIMKKSGNRKEGSVKLTVILDPNPTVQTSDLSELNSVFSDDPLSVDSSENSQIPKASLNLAPMDGVSTPIQVYKLEVCHGAVRNNSSLANDSFFFGSMSESDNHLPSPLRKLDKRPSEVPPSTSKNPKSPVEDFHYQTYSHNF
jgi:hypothetical protein